MKLSSFTLKTLVQSIANALNLRPTKTEVDASIAASTASTSAEITSSTATTAANITSAKNLITSSLTTAIDNSTTATQSFINQQNNTLTTYIYSAADDVKASVDNSKFFIEGVVNSAADGVKLDLSTALQTGFNDTGVIVAGAKNQILGAVSDTQTYLDSAVYSSRSYLDNLLTGRFNQSDNLALNNKEFVLQAVNNRATALDTAVAGVSTQLTTRANTIDSTLAGLPNNIITQIKALRSGQLQLLSNDSVVVPADATLASGVNAPVQVQTSGNATAVNWRTSVNFSGFTTLDYFYGALVSAGYTGSNIAVFQIGSFYYMLMLGYYGISPNILKLDSNFNVVEVLSYATAVNQGYCQTAFQYNNEIYIVLNSPSVSLQLFKFNPTTAVTTALASVTNANQRSAVVVPDLTANKVYFFGGTTSGGAQSTIKTTYDIATNTFTQPTSSVSDIRLGGSTGLGSAPTGIRFANKVHVTFGLPSAGGSSNAVILLYSEVTGSTNIIQIPNLTVPAGYSFPANYSWLSNVFTTDGIHMFIKAGTVPDISGVAGGAWLKYVVNADLTLTLVGPVDFGDFYVNNQPVTTNMIPLRIWNYTVMNGCTLFYKGTRVNAVYPMLTFVKVADILNQKYSYFVRYN